MVWRYTGVGQVERVENTVLWKNYHRKKAAMAELSRGSRQPPDEIKPSGGLDVLDRELNEVSAIGCAQRPTSAAGAVAGGGAVFVTLGRGGALHVPATLTSPRAFLHNARAHACTL